MSSEQSDVGASDSLGWLLRLAFATDPARSLLTLIPIGPLLFGAVALAGRRLIDVTQGGSADGLAGVAAAAGVASALTLLLGWWQYVNGALRLSQSIGVAVDAELLHSLSAPRSLPLFDGSKVLDRLELLRVGRHALTSGVGVVRDAFQLAVSAVVTAALLIVVDPRLAALPLATIPVILVFYRTERAVNAAEEAGAGRRRTALHLYDIGTADGPAKELRVFRQHRALRDLYQRTWASLDLDLTAAGTRAAIARAGAWLVYTVAVGAALVLAVGAPVNRPVGGGDLFLIAVVVVMLADQVGWAAMTAAQAKRTFALAGHVLWITRRSRGLRQEAAVQPAPVRITDGLTLANVGFRYPGSEHAVLTGIDLHLPAGTSVAVVGENGAGKSTLVKLLCGLYQPTDGRITIDGQPLDTVDPDDWFTRVSAVYQDFACFEFLLRETVGVGHLPSLDDEQAVTAAIRRGGADGVVRAAANGLGSQLGGRFGGTDLSRGQWQRLAVARGLLQPHPLLLVLDEPTLAIDATTEQQLLSTCIREARSLAEEHGTIVVFVSHRYSTVRNADQIVVLDNGRIIETGTHDQLVAAGGRYARMYDQQAATYR